MTINKVNDFEEILSILKLCSDDFFDKEAMAEDKLTELASKFSKTKIIGVGAAVGFSRLMVALMDDNRIDLTQFESPVDVAVLCMGNENLSYAVSVLNALRDAGVASIAYLDADKKFKNQIEYADKINAKFSMIIGETEVKNQVVAMKNMASGEQQNLTIADAIKILVGV